MSGASFPCQVLSCSNSYRPAYVEHPLKDLPSFRSLFYERTVLRHLERVRHLPVEVQTEIAVRVSNFIDQARTVSDERLEPFAQVAREEQQRAVQLGVKSDLDPTLAAPAISEAWCKAKLGLAIGSLNEHSAMEIIVAIETFTSRRASDHRHRAC